MQGKVKHQKSVNVWGCFSWNGVGDLYRVKGIMTGPVYCQILIHHFVPSARQLCGNNFVFQHDNDPKHTSRVVQQYLANKKVTLYNNYSKTCNLIGQYPCRMRQSCTGNLKVDIASHFTSLLRAYNCRQKTFQLLKLAENEDKVKY